jgi:hypothetical protein
VGEVGRSGLAGGAGAVVEWESYEKTYSSVSLFASVNRFAEQVQLKGLRPQLFRNVLWISPVALPAAFFWGADGPAGPGRRIFPRPMKTLLLSSSAA